MQIGNEHRAVQTTEKNDPFSVKSLVRQLEVEYSLKLSGLVTQFRKGATFSFDKVETEEKKRKQILALIHGRYV